MTVTLLISITLVANSFLLVGQSRLTQLGADSNRDKRGTNYHASESLSTQLVSRKGLTSTQKMTTERTGIQRESRDTQHRPVLSMRTAKPSPCYTMKRLATTGCQRTTWVGQRVHREIGCPSTPVY